MALPVLTKAIYIASWTQTWPYVFHSVCEPNPSISPCPALSAHAERISEIDLPEVVSWSWRVMLQLCNARTQRVKKHMDVWELMLYI